ncbi:MAG: tyrosine--tRNA ligase [Bacteroidia bacterium]|nr:tyrosine--tRNA ligase [Bacteroidia bacterium]
MKSGFLKDLKERGLLHNFTPGTDEELLRPERRAYIGFDPTADSLHVGSLLQIITLARFYSHGHKPIALLGGATGMVGDPSGKSKERNLLSPDEIRHNLEAISKQIQRILSNYRAEAEVLNNYDWIKDFSFLDFIREVGKHITVNYMLAKDSVKNRLENGMSFTEFSYQLLQAYDFLWLYQHKGCTIQMGGSDQWGNITTGTELIRRKINGQAFALTTTLIKKADGTKFGKTESGNVWLDARKTSPYKFYQFWLNAADEDIEHFIYYFSIKPKEETVALVQKHKSGPEQRILQKALAEELTIFVHSKEDCENAIKASEVLFKGTEHDFKALDEATLLEIMDGVPRAGISRDKVTAGILLPELLTDLTGFLPSRSEAKKLIQSGGFSINRRKVLKPDLKVDQSFLLKDKFILLQKGKKNYFLCVVE